MTDVAQPIDDTARDGRIDIDAGILALPAGGGAGPKTVYVRAVAASDGTNQAGFALQPISLTWKTGGVEWEFEAKDASYGLFINFVLVSGVIELFAKEPLPGDPVSWFSETYAPPFGQGKNQLYCAPLVASGPTTYHVVASLTTGEMFDPKIVVSPIPGDGELSARNS